MLTINAMVNYSMVNIFSYGYYSKSLNGITVFWNALLVPESAMLDCFVCSYYTLLPEQLINQSYLASLEYRPNCNVSILKHAFISLSDFM